MGVTATFGAVEQRGITRASVLVKLFRFEELEEGR
jgi:hypothetical protein